MKVKVAPLPSADDKKSFDQYEKEGFHRTLLEAEMIKQDSKKHAAAMEIMKKHHKAMKSMNMEQLVEKASNLTSDANTHDCEDCGVDMGAMSKAQITQHKKSHKA